MSRIKPSHIPVFPDAYLRDNYRLSLEQHGLFLLLMFEAWNQPDCSLPDNDEALAAIAQISVTKFRKIAGPVLEKWTRESGRIYQKRLLKEWRYTQSKRQQAREAVTIREQRRRASDDASDDHRTINTYGGGGGGGGVSQSQGKGLEGETYTREGRLTVLPGGAK